MGQNLGNLKHQNISEEVNKSREDPVSRARRNKREGV